MDREQLLKISKELVDALVNKKNTTLKKEHYFMLSISKYIMTKEKLIRTDSNGRKLYFDDTEENIKIIEDFYESIKDNISFGISDDNVSDTESKEKIDALYDNVILTNNNENIELKKKVFIVNKLRDSFAHGRYKIDTSKNLIIVKNDYDVNGTEYVFNCQISPDVLTTFANKNAKTNIALKETLNESINNTLNNKMFLNISKSVMNLKDKFTKEEYKFNQEEIEEFDKLFNEALNNINTVINLKKIKTKNPLSLSYTKSVKEISKDSIIKTWDYNVEKELVDRVAEILIAMASILDKKLNDKSIETAVVYNYLTLLLSERKELDFRYLRSPSLQVSFKKKSEPTGENDITGTLGALRREIKLFNRKYKKINNYPENVKQKAMMELYLNLYNGIMDALENRNRNIYNRIRNGIMHCSIEVTEKRIIIKDSKEHDMNDPSFTVKATNKELLEYADLIERTDLKETYTFATFITELYITLTNYEFQDEQSKEFFENLSNCLSIINKNIKLSTSTESFKEQLVKMTTPGYLENIERLESVLLARKEELDSKPPSM